MDLNAYQMPPTPSQCERENCLTNTTDREFSVLFDPKQQVHYCQTCGMRMKNKTYYIAYRDADKEMIPASEDGFISLFPSFEDARNNAGALGVAAAVDGERLREIAERHGLKVKNL